MSTLIAHSTSSEFLFLFLFRFVFHIKPLPSGARVAFLPQFFPAMAKAEEEGVKAAQRHASWQV